MKKKYDVFISYRREGGQDTARIIRDELRARGFSVFFDVETLRSGKFNVQLLDTIQECGDFILICSPGALDRCRNEDDWVRQELACALKHGKNVIPVLLRGFAFPPAETLPEDIRDVFYCNGLSASHEHFDSFIDKLAEFLKTPKGLRSFVRSLPFNGRRAAAAIAAGLVLAGAVGFGAHKLFSGPDFFPGTEEEIVCTDRLINCCVQNLAVYNEALDIYDSAVEELNKYTENRSSYQKQYSFDEYALLCRDKILLQAEGLQRLDEMDASLIQDANRILGERLNIGNANMMMDALSGCINSMTYSLSYFAELYCANGRNLADAALAAGLEDYRRLAELDRDSIFYAFNEMLLPVDNPDIVNAVKTQYLPVLTALYARQDWKTDSADIQSQLDSIYNMQRRIVAGMEESLTFDQEQQQKLEEAYDAYLTTLAEEERLEAEPEGNGDLDAETESTLRRIDNLIVQLENRKIIESILYNDKEKAGAYFDELIGKFQTIRASLADKYERLQAAREELADLQERLRAAKEEAREKFRPLETDDIGLLWGKALRFITLKMPDMAGECFDLFAQKEGSEEAAVYTARAKLFADSVEETGVAGGCIVCGYEEGLPRQEFEIGDILYAVDGQEIRTAEEFIEARGDREALIGVLRFGQDGSFQLMEIRYNAGLGRIMLLSLNERENVGQEEVN